MDQLHNELDQLPPEVAAELPDEVKQLIELKKAQKQQQIDKLGEVVGKKRDEAVKARASSGIETEWEEDEEAYQGFDEVNRKEGKAYKPAAINGSFISSRQTSSTRSTVFLNITRPYVDAAAARLADMLLPTDDRNWSIKPTPIAEAVSALDAAKKMPPEQMAAMPPEQQQAIADKVSQLQKIQDDASAKAEAAEKRIEDWMVQCQYHAEVRKLFENCARIGTGILKGPTPTRRKNIAFADGQMVIKMDIEPESKSIDPWNFYPDPACGEDIHSGSYVIERDDITVRKLRELKQVPGYLADRIDKVIEEGPNKENCDDFGRNISGKQTDNDEQFSIWYYYGIVDREDLEAMGLEVDDTTLDGVPAIVTLVNDTPIKAALNPLDSGEFPYDVMPWQRRAGYWAGVGVSRQIRTPQRMINAATRNMMDNSGLSGGPILVVRRNLVQPADGNWELRPRKLFYVSEEGDARSVADAITSIIVPSNQPEMMGIIQFALKMAEDVTGLPQIMQGQQGNAPDTVGGMQMLQNNAGTVMRRIAKTYDDKVTEPHIRRYYQWLMMYGEDEEKGDFMIDARGSSALVERDLQNQSILQMGAMVANPAFGIDPEKWFQEMCRAQRLDPKKFTMDEEKKQQLAQQPPPEAPQVAVAKIRAQVDMERTKMQTQAEMQRAKMDTDRDLVYVQAQERRDQTMAMSRIEELKLKRELAYLQLQVNKGINVDDNKVRLADTAMKLRMQKELAMMNAHTKQVATPATEPPGRAPNGQAFQR